MELIYALAALGAYRVLRRAVIIVRVIWKDRNAPRVPWMGLPPWGMPKG